MNRTKLLLFVLAAVLVGVAFFVGTTDRFSGTQNCGAALFPRDTEQLTQESGDPIEDDFAAEVRRDQCAHEILTQRLLMGLLLLGAIGAVIAAVRVRPRPQRFPGDPIV